MPLNPGKRYPEKSKVEKVVETAKISRTLVGGVCAVLGVFLALTGFVLPGVIAVFIGGWITGHGL